MFDFPSPATPGQVYEPNGPGTEPAYTYDGTTWLYQATTQLLITAVLPNQAQVGTALLPAVRAIGANMTATTEVLIDNVAVPTVFVSASEVTFAVDPVPETVPRTAIITVQDGTTTGIGAVPFQFTAATVLTITLLQPDNAQVAAPALIVSAAGANFTPTTEILFDALPVPTTFVSTTQLTFQVDPTVETLPRTVPVTVRDGAIAGIGAPPFAFTNAIIVEKIIPSFGQVGATNLLVTVEGEGFLVSSVIWLNGVAQPTVYSSGTALEMTLDGTAAAAGTLPVEVRNGTLISNNLPFTWAARPLITTLTPDVIGASDGPKTITVAGTGFTADSRVLETGVGERATTFVSATSLTFSVSPLAEGYGPHTASITVQAGNGTPPVVSPASTLQYWANPVITQLTPTTAAIAAGPFILTVVGSGMSAGTIIIVDGVEQATTQVGPAEYTCSYTPTGAARAVPVLVRNGHVGHFTDDIRPLAPATLTLT